MDFNAPRLVPSVPQFSIVQKTVAASILNSNVRCIQILMCVSILPSWYVQHDTLLRLWDTTSLTTWYTTWNTTWYDMIWHDTTWYDMKHLPDYWNDIMYWLSYQHDDIYSTDRYTDSRHANKSPNGGKSRFSSIFKTKVAEHRDISLL